VVSGYGCSVLDQRSSTTECAVQSRPMGEAAQGESARSDRLEGPDLVTVNPILADNRT
jgi:hypothetical protein